MLEVFENSIEDLISGYRVVVVKVIVSGCFSVVVESFYSVQVDTFFLKLYHLHGVIYISKGLQVFCWMLCVFLCLGVILCSLNLVLKFYPVCPMYAFTQSGHISLYTPDCVNLSWL